MGTTLIKGGTIVTASDSFVADMVIAGEVIGLIGRDLSIQADQTVDATGMFVMPGGIDVHTHLDMPFMGTRSRDDFETGTRAAAFGGTTAIVDFVTPEKGKPLAQALADWNTRAHGHACIDYGFHMCIVDMNPAILAEMDALVGEGITSFKLFTAYPNSLMIDDAAIYRVMQWAARSGALVQAHCENGPAIAAIVADMMAAGNTEPIDHIRSRPSALEGEATHRVLALAKVAGAPVYVVHLTCKEALDAVRAARAAGQAVFAETCPQYLYLSEADADRPDFEGAKFVCSPPLRPAWHAEHLWKGLAAGDLQTVATDHCPFDFRGQKDAGLTDFRKIPNGLPAIETRLMLVHQGVNDGHISFNRFVDLVSTTPAKLFGLYPKKGLLAPGADADVVLWNPRREMDLSVAKLHMRVDYSPYEGRKVFGGPDKVFSRGRLIVDKDRFVGEAGAGRFVPRARFSQP